VTVSDTAHQFNNKKGREMHRAVNAIAVGNVSGALGLESAQILGFTVNEVAALGMLFCAVVSVCVSVFMACVNFKRGKK